MAVSKRVQVLLRDRIADIVEGLAECEGISVSRVCGSLIEEALKAKGPLTIDGQLHARAGVQVQSVVTNQRTPDQPSPWKQMEEKVLRASEQAPSTSQPLDNEADDDDEMVELLEMAKKLKTLQKAGLL